MRIRLSTSKQAIDPYGPAMSSLGTLSDDDPFLDITDPVGQGVLNDELAGEKQWREDFQRRMREAKAPTARTNRLNQRADALNARAEAMRANTARMEKLPFDQWYDEWASQPPASGPPPSQQEDRSNFVRTSSKSLGNYMPRSALPQGSPAATTTPQPGDPRSSVYPGGGAGSPAATTTPQPGAPAAAAEPDESGHPASGVYPGGSGAPTSRPSWGVDQLGNRLRGLRNEFRNKGLTDLNIGSATGGPRGEAPSASFTASITPGEKSKADPFQFRTGVLHRDQFGSQEDYAQTLRGRYHDLREQLQGRLDQQMAAAKKTQDDSGGSTWWNPFSWGSSADEGSTKAKAAPVASNEQGETQPPSARSPADPLWGGDRGETVQPTTSPDPNRNESPWRSAYRTAKDVYGNSDRRQRYMQHEKQYGADETANDVRYYNALQRKLQQEGHGPDEARRIARNTVQTRAQERSKPPEFSMYQPWTWF